MRNNRILGVAFASLALLAGTHCQAQPYSNAVTALNPVAYWPLTENVAAPAGLYVATNSGTLGAVGQGYYETWYQPFGASPAMLPTNVIQHPLGVTKDNDAALQDSLIGQHVIIPRTTNGVANAAVTLNPPFSIELWVYPTNTGGSLKPLVSEGFENILNGPSLGNQTAWEGVTIGSFNNIFYFSTFNGVTGKKNEIDTAAFTANVWHHLVATFNGTTMLFYDNGVQKSLALSTRNALGQLYTADLVNPLIIGAGASQNSPFLGIIDEVAIYTNVLTAQQVTNHLFAQTTNSPASYYATTVAADNPAIYLRLDEPAFTGAPDLSTCPVANNYGSLGAAANGRYQPGTTPGSAGPAYSGFGASSYAVALNGFNGGVDVGLGSLPAQLNPTGAQPLTVLTWFKGNPADCFGRFQEILGHGDASWRMGLDFNGGNRFNPGAGPELLFSGINDTLVNGMNLNDGNWHFAAGVSDGTNDYLYLDGVLAKSGTAVAGIPGTNLDLILGGDPQYTAPANGAGGSRYFDGNLAHVAFYTNALSAAQIQGIYSAAGVSPVVRVQPASQAAFSGQVVSLAPVIFGSANLTYQWYKNGSVLTGQTGPSLTFNPVGTGNAGAYYVAATNAYGWTTSFVAQLTVSSASASAYASAVKNLGPVAYWPLDETTQPPFGQYIATNLGTAGVLGQGYYETWFQAVANGSGGQATYYQTNFIQHVPGAIGDGTTAMQCNRNLGSGQYVVIPRSANGVPNPTTTLTPPFSVEFWAQPYTILTNAVMCFITQGRNPALDATFTSTNESGFSIGQYGGNLFFATWNNTGQDGTKKELDVAWTANAWHHVVITFDGTNKVAYVDGAQAGTQTVTSYAVDTSSPLVLGTGSIPAAGNGSSEWFGALGEVAIYTNILQLSDVQAHYSVASATDSSYRDAVLANFPTIYLRLGEPAFSSYPSPSAYPAAVNYGLIGPVANGAYQPGTTPGVPGPGYAGFGGSHAVAINGFSGAVTVGGGNLPPQLNPVGNQGMTVAAWVQGAPTDAPQRFQGVVGHGGSSWRLALDSNSGGLRWNPGNNPEVQFTSAPDVVNSGALVNDGKWHFVVGVSDGATASLYVDGALVRSSNSVAAITGSGVDALIGGDPSTLVPVWNGGATTAPRYFDGNIAQVAFFTNALSAGQISQLYTVAGVPPTITLQPQSITTNAGANIALTVGAKGSPTLGYQWYKNGSALAGQTATSLAFTPVVLNNSGNYYAVATNAYGSATSSVVTLTVFGPPVVEQQSPTTVRVFVGTSPMLRATALGPEPISYQWTRDGSPVSGATASSFIPGTAVTGTHTYSCTITNIYSTNTPSAFSAISVTVLTAPTAPYPAAVLGDHPAFYYRLDEGPDNGSGNNGTAAYDYAGGLNAVYTNAYIAQPGYDSMFMPQTDPSETAATFGSLSTIDSFAGNVSSYLSFAATNGASAAFSIETWVNGGFGQAAGAGIVALGYGNGGEQFNLDTGAANHDYRFFVRDAGGTAHLANGTNAPNDGGWHHLIGVCDQPNGRLSLYVDGILNGSGTIGTNSGVLPWMVPMSIGSRQSGNGTPYDSYFAGSIDDVAIYPYALSPGQVLAHYNSAGVPARVVTQPVDITTNEGATATFNVAAAGTAPLAYQWFDNNGQPIASGTAATLTLANVHVDQSGLYYATVTNLYSAGVPAISASANLTVLGGPPNLDVDLQPLFHMAYANRTFSYTVAVSGTAPFHYLWTRNNVAIPGATNTTYTFTTLAGTNFYVVTVTNLYGSVTSSTATNVGLPALTLNPGDYLNKVKITFAGYNRPESLLNFPALVNLGTNLPGFEYSQFASPSGGDLRFTDSTGTNQIPYEVDEWNPAGTSPVWVQVPVLSGTNDSIWAYWNNPAATVPPAWATNGEVWVPAFGASSPYEVVYHLKESGFPYADSTTLHNSTNGVGPTPTPGIVGTGGAFGGSSWLDAGTNDVGDVLTLSAWANVAPGASSIQTFWANQHGGFGAPGFAFWVNSYGTTDQVLDLATGNGAGGGNESKSPAITFGQWHLLDAVINRTNGTVSFYVDGVDVFNGTQVVKDFNTLEDLRLGRFVTDGFYFNGIMDEARIRADTSSANWIWAEYMTVAQNDSFESYGPLSGVNVVLNHQVINGKLVLSWSQGTLLEAPAITGPWTTNNTLSPYTNNLSFSQHYYRVKVR